MQSYLRTRGCDYLLLLGTSELSENGLSYGGWRLNSKRVHKHRRSGRHTAFVIVTAVESNLGTGRNNMQGGQR